MVQKLEAIRGGGGSIKVGTTGTVSALITRELESIKSAPQTSVSHQDKPKTVAVSVPCSVSTTRRLPVRKSLNEASSSSTNHRSTEAAQKMKNYNRSAHRMPMLSSENASIERTPIREKTKKKRTNIVDIVDIKCGHTDKAWASPITSKLKKLGFSKLSESII